MQDRSMYQFRYVAYAFAHEQRSPEAMMEHDVKAWPGGCMAGFILWSMDMWSKWKDQQPESRRKLAYQFGWVLNDQDHKDFDVFLADQVGLRVSGS